MKIVSICSSELITPWTTPPECGGQIVEHSYARTESLVLHRIHDRSDGQITISAHTPGRGSYEPQNREPKLGRKVGFVTITHR